MKKIYLITILIILICTSCRPTPEPDVTDNNQYALITDIFQNDYSNRLYGFGEIIRHTMDYNNIGIDFIRGEIQGYNYGTIFTVVRMQDPNIKYINQYLKDDNLAKILIEIVALLPRYLGFIEDNLHDAENILTYKPTLTRISELERDLNTNFSGLEESSVEFYYNKANELKKLLEEELE